MSVREFRSSDGRRWRVWAVLPQGFGAAPARRGAPASNAQAAERRAADRRIVPVEALADPPVLQRRRGADRRATDAGGRRASLSRRPGRAAAARPPARWRHGWLVFERVDTALVLPGAGARPRETRRLAPMPDGWDACTDAELGEHLRAAVDGQAPRRDLVP